MLDPTEAVRPAHIVMFLVNHRTFSGIGRGNQGGVLLIDDYGHWKGAHQAVDECITESGVDYTVRTTVRAQ